MAARVVVLALVLLLPSVARADDPPWSRGVAPARRTEAQKRLEAGNELLLRGDHRGALGEYEAAIRAWDHPAIRFNMVRALINLDRVVDAADNLELALRYGKGPLEEQVYAEALNYQRLLATQIGTLTVRCDQDGVAVSVDGKPLGTCPISRTLRVAPGTHVVVGARTGFLTSTRDVLVLPGKTLEAEVALRSLADVTETRSRWSAWKPWAVVGSGLVLAAAGGLLQWHAAGLLDDYRGEVDRLCAGDGCGPGELPGAVDALGDRAIVENRVALSMIGVGGAIAATGVVLVVMNRPRAYVVEVRGGLGVAVAGRF